jgi:hypothetical protein
MASPTGQLITEVDVREYFQNVLTQVLDRQSVPVRDETVLYLTNLLAGFVRSEQLYDQTPDGIMIRPLVALYGEAVNARTVEEEYRALQRLGDLALFVSGLFAHSLSRSLVDVDYYIAMGGNAYASIASSERLSRTRRTLRAVFSELAERFVAVVDVLAEVGEAGNLHTSHDILRLYEIWLASGSPRAAARLRQLGIEPVRAQRRSH